MLPVIAFPTRTVCTILLLHKAFLLRPFRNPDPFHALLHPTTLSSRVSQASHMPPRGHPQTSPIINHTPETPYYPLPPQRASPSPPGLHYSVNKGQISLLEIIEKKKSKNEVFRDLCYRLTFYLCSPITFPSHSDTLTVTR